MLGWPKDGSAARDGAQPPISLEASGLRLEAAQSNPYGVCGDAFVASCRNAECARNVPSGIASSGQSSNSKMNNGKVLNLLTAARREDDRFHVLSLRSWIVAPRGHHSEKPNAIRDSLERANSGPRLELAKTRTALARPGTRDRRVADRSNCDLIWHRRRLTDPLVTPLLVMSSHKGLLQRVNFTEC
jgi:hypothetical protein